MTLDKTMKEALDLIKELQESMGASRQNIDDSHNSLCQAIQAAEELANYEYIQPDFDPDLIICCFSMHDNDFRNPLQAFAELVAHEMTCIKPGFTSAQKMGFYTRLWKDTCLSLYRLGVRTHWLEPDGAGNLFDPDKSRWSHTEDYMQTNFVITFDEGARNMYAKYSEFGNGEFVFVDSNGSIGYL